jgi:hypothetical protein
LSNSFKNDSDSLGESGGSASHEDQDLELKKQELELCQTGPKFEESFTESIGYNFLLILAKFTFTKPYT